MHDDSDSSDFSYKLREKKQRGPFFLSEEGAAVRSLVGSEVPRELALFTAVEGRMIEEGAGCAAPLRPLVFLLVYDGLHYLTARVNR